MTLPNFGLKKALGSLLDDADLIEADRRVHGRVPFYQPARLELADASNSSHPVFTRDVSRDGIGLLHNEPIEPQIVTLSVTCSTGDVASFKLHLDWCLSCGEGWYISGGGFADDGAETAKLNFNVSTDG